MVSVWCVSEAIKVKISCGIACHHGLKACDVFGGVFITLIYANHIYVLHFVLPIVFTSVQVVQFLCQSSRNFLVYLISVKSNKVGFCCDSDITHVMFLFYQWRAATAAASIYRSLACKCA